MFPSFGEMPIAEGTMGRSGLEYFQRTVCYPALAPAFRSHQP